MATFQALLFCTGFVIGSIWATIPYNQIDINIFDDRPSDFEFRVIESTQTVKNFFDRGDVMLAIAGGMVALNATPYIGNFSKLIPMARDTLADQGEWRRVFSKAIANETMRSITESEIRWMKSTLKTIQTKMRLLGDDNPDFENRKTIASLIHTDLNKMIKFFDLKSSLFRKYPLLGAPPLIHLASLVATFCPIAKTLIPLEARNPQISCKMYDILTEDFLPRVILIRMQKLNAEITVFFKHIFKSFVKVMSLPFNEFGYNQTNPGAIDCVKARKDQMEIIADTYGSNAYYVGIDEYTTTCIIDYVSLVRHRIEALFPVEQLKKMCVNRAPKKPTGNFFEKIVI